VQLALVRTRPTSGADSLRRLHGRLLRRAQPGAWRWQRLGDNDQAGFCQDSGPERFSLSSPVNSTPKKRWLTSCALSKSARTSTSPAAGRATVAGRSRDPPRGIGHPMACAGVANAHPNAAEPNAAFLEGARDLLGSQVNLALGPQRLPDAPSQLIWVSDRLRAPDLPHPIAGPLGLSI
jgi:hypothetical protein